MARILLVEDVADVRETVRLSLERAGHDVAEAENGQAALTLSEATDFDLVITDIWMPGMDGVTLLKRLRERRPGVKILVMSGGGPKVPLEVAASMAETWGADKIVYKPFRSETLVNEVGQLLARA
ncbi:response regulator [Oceanibacterium hippocampi]|uniref:Transcriptional regulatory protein SrrA n=1 Tax=Oceanibacterium hippocampi TaxID=745714 RepID=A0A1Y5T4Y3_9PROT|nr:response regulator [Oceanibacterium hippocampi]SLN56031.1 Transcriptional regulatory protein SrrA [Oceanibacterium hippocampi]